MIQKPQYEPQVTDKTLQQQKHKSKMCCNTILGKRRDLKNKAAAIEQI
jgi:hypothetical protein